LNDLPFRFAGQYEDIETGLYYNRFRYYDPSIGSYLSQDPIGLVGNNPTLYGYVNNVNFYVDIFGLAAKAFDLDTFGNISNSKNIGDNLTAHELLQHAWLQQNGKLPTSQNRGVDKISKDNPSIALREKGMHSKITGLQNKHGMKGKNLKGQSALQNINRNAALTRRGIMEGLIADGMDKKSAKIKATNLTNKLRQNAIAHAKANKLISSH
jgi:RHS repeat-associated protein